MSKENLETGKFRYFKGRKEGRKGGWEGGREGDRQTEGERERGRDRNIHVWLPFACPNWGPGPKPRHVL